MEAASWALEKYPVRQSFPKVTSIPPPILATCWFPGGRPRRYRRAIPCQSPIRAAGKHAANPASPAKRWPNAAPAGLDDHEIRPLDGLPPWRPGRIVHRRSDAGAHRSHCWRRFFSRRRLSETEPRSLCEHRQRAIPQPGRFNSCVRRSGFVSRCANANFRQSSPCRQRCARGGRFNRCCRRPGSVCPSSGTTDRQGASPRCPASHDSQGDAASVRHA
jgi:hypothetical protein